MSKEKIEEMAKDLAKHSFFYNGGCMMNYHHTAKLLYEAGYRKQSEWISVDERLPNELVSVLGYVTDAGDLPPVRECYLVGKVFFFPAVKDRHPVSHWMPLPEPPKMKGGAE